MSLKYAGHQEGAPALQKEDVKFTATEIGDLVKRAQHQEGSLCCDGGDAQEEGGSGAGQEGRSHQWSSPPPTRRLAVSEVGIGKKEKQAHQQKGKKSRRKSVASHTGKYADEATARAVLAASIAGEDVLQRASEKLVDTGHPMKGNRDADGQGDGAGVVSFSLSGSQRGKLKKKRDKIGSSKRRPKR